MLVLSRRPNESIVFPPTGISVQVLDVRGASVKIGLTAPPDVKILRGEVQDREPAGADRRYPVSPGLRDDLQQLNVLLHLYRGQRDLGQLDQADATLTQALSLLADLSQSTGGQAPLGNFAALSP